MATAGTWTEAGDRFLSWIDLSPHIKDLIDVKAVSSNMMYGLLGILVIFGVVNACIMTVGAVVTCNEIPTDESPYRLGVDFSYIRDDDQELLVKHVVQKQSRSIRKTRPVRG